jgi:hypothetical protein
MQPNQSDCSSVGIQAHFELHRHDLPCSFNLAAIRSYGYSACAFHRINGLPCYFQENKIALKMLNSSTFEAMWKIRGAIRLFRASLISFRLLVVDGILPARIRGLRIKDREWRNEGGVRRGNGA